MSNKNPVYTVNLGDLHFEAVLDSGFLGTSLFSDELHAHAYCELILASEGSVWIDQPHLPSVQLSSGELCLLPPGVYHSTRPFDGSSEKLAIRFRCTRGEQQAMYLPMVEALGRSALITFGEQPQLYHTLLELKQELCSDKIGQALFLQSLLTQSFLILLRLFYLEDTSHADSPTEDLSARRVQLEDYLFENFHKPITEETLAQHMHLSKRQLNRVLQQSYGKSFRTLLSEIRMQQAAQMLVKTELPIEQVAISVGYSSISGFYHTFRKLYNTTAGIYREQYKTANFDNKTQCIP